MIVTETSSPASEASIAKLMGQCYSLATLGGQEEKAIELLVGAMENSVGLRQIFTNQLAALAALEVQLGVPLSQRCFMSDFNKRVLEKSLTRIKDKV